MAAVRPRPGRRRLGELRHSRVAGGRRRSLWVEDDHHGVMNGLVGAPGGHLVLQYPPGILVAGRPPLPGRPGARPGAARAVDGERVRSAPRRAGAARGVPLGGDDRAGPQRRDAAGIALDRPRPAADRDFRGDRRRRDRSHLLRRAADLLLAGRDDPRAGLRPGRAAAPGARPPAGDRERAARPCGRGDRGRGGDGAVWIGGSGGAGFGGDLRHSRHRPGRPHGPPLQAGSVWPEFWPSRPA